MKREKFAYTLLAPMIIIMLVLVIYPIAATFSYSLKKWKLSKPNDIRFIGLKNYINILNSESFLQSVKNTLFILGTVVIFTTIVLLAIAIVPWAIPPFVNALLWKFVFYSGYGFLNKLLLNLHLISTPISWLDNRYSLLFIVSIVVSYRLIPFMTLICLAGRQSISDNLIEAAKIDGAGHFMVFKKIITPLMLPFLAVGITQTSISAINVFDEIVALSGYSDMGKSMLIESYLITFNFLEFGKGSAYTYIIMLFAGILGFVYIKSLNREVEF